MAKILIAIASVIIVLFVFHFIIPVAIVGWDESVFLLAAYNIYKSVQEGNTREFIRISLEQFSYPPFQSWAIGLPLTFFGFTVENARIINLLWFALGGHLVYALGTGFAGTISAFLYLTSPLLIVFAGIALKETMGTTLTIITMLLYLKARTTTKMAFYLAASFALTILTMTKYNYGILLMLSFAVEGLISLFLKKKQRRATLLTHAVLCGIPVLLVGLWVFFPVNQFARFMTILTNPVPWTARATLTDSLLFYPRSIVLMYAPSPALGFLLIAGWLASVVRLGDVRVRSLWIPVCVNILLGTIHTGNMQERYILTVMPFLFVLTGLSLSSWIRALPRRASMIMMCALSLVVARDMWSFPALVRSVGSYSQKFPQFNERDYRDLWFTYDPSRWARSVPPLANEKPADVVDFVTSSIDLTKPIRIAGRSNELAPDYFALSFAIAREQGTIHKLPHPSYTVTIEVFPASPYYTYDYKERNAWLLGEVRAVQHNPSYTLIHRKRFEELGMEIGIYTP